jgi:hypothetical protein
MSRGGRLIAFAVALSGVAVGAASFRTAGPASLQAASLDSLLSQASTYVLGFEERFAVVLSDEDYEQHSTGRYGRSRETGRTLKSETIFLWLTEERAWLTARNVLSVDGRPVQNSRERLDRLLSGTGSIGIARLRALRDEGARFNLGSIQRNFNDPMLPLRFLEPATRPRFKFSLAGEEKVGGSPTSKVAFEEQARPTVIQENRIDRPSHGVIWIRPDGTVMRTRLEVRGTDGPRNVITASIVVDYNSDKKIGMMVPGAMHETYMQLVPAGAGGVGERITCTATYSNFRRFETSARIVPDG